MSALKQALLPFVHKLSDAELDALEATGVVLTPAGPGGGKKSKGISFRSAMCIGPSL